MFGYIRPRKDSLRVAEYEYYRGLYCGVCRRMGKECGSASRLCLSYDQVFLCLVRTLLTDDIPEFSRKSCPAFPLKKLKAAESTSVDYSAAVGAVLAAYKFDDDKRDESGTRRFAASLGRGCSRPWLRRAEKLYPGLASGIYESLDGFCRAENDACSGGSGSADVSGFDGFSLDAVADAFGRVAGFFTSYGLEGRQAAVAAAVGRHAGRWLFMVDAADDMAEDVKKGRNNVLARAYGENGPGEEEKKTLLCLLNAETDAALDVLELADIAPGTRLEILKNILSEGMPQTAEAVLNRTYRKPRRHEE